MPDIYENARPRDQILNEAIGSKKHDEGIEIDHYDFSNGNGIEVYLKDNPLTVLRHPMKGLATPEAIQAMNVVKKVLLLIVAHPLLFLRPQRLVRQLTETLWPIASPYVLKPEYQMRCAWELSWFINDFLRQTGLCHEINSFYTGQGNLSTILSHIIEYDSAYRFRFQDLMSRTSKEALMQRPIREALRLIRIARKGDSAALSLKFRLLAPLFLLVLLRYRTAFKNTLSVRNFNNFLPDEHDLYWMSKRTDYKYD